MQRITFAEWLKAVDAVLLQRVGLPSDCLPDGPSYQSYEDGYSPKRYASKLIRLAKGEME